MFIVSKDRESIINAELLTVLYLGAERRTIKADFLGGKGCQIAGYDSEAAARAALETVANNAGKSEVIFLPDDKEIKAKMLLKNQKPHQINGKKMKRHGGS